MRALGPSDHEKLIAMIKTLDGHLADNPNGLVTLTIKARHGSIVGTNVSVEKPWGNG